MELLSILKYFAISIIAILAAVVIVMNISMFFLMLMSGEMFGSDEAHSYVYQAKYKNSNNVIARFLGCVYEAGMKINLEVIKALPYLVGVFSTLTLVWVCFDMAKT